MLVLCLLLLKTSYCRVKIILRVDSTNARLALWILKWPPLVLKTIYTCCTLTLSNHKNNLNPLCTIFKFRPEACSLGKARVVVAITSFGARRLFLLCWKHNCPSGSTWCTKRLCTDCWSYNNEINTQGQHNNSWAPGCIWSKSTFTLSANCSEYQKSNYKKLFCRLYYIFDYIN